MREMVVSAAVMAGLWTTGTWMLVASIAWSHAAFTMKDFWRDVQAGLQEKGRYSAKNAMRFMKGKP